MFQTMEQCTDFIFKLKASQYKGEPLQSAKIILDALGNPEQKTKAFTFRFSSQKRDLPNLYTTTSSSATTATFSS